jgi:hypothetical protein
MPVQEKHRKESKDSRIFPIGQEDIRYLHDNEKDTVLIIT